MTRTAQRKPELLILGAEHLHRKATYGSDNYADFVVRKVQRIAHMDDEPLEAEVIVVPYTFCLGIKGHGGNLTCSAPPTLMAALERQILHTLQSGQMVCFLVESVVRCAEPRDEYTELEQIYNCFGFDDESLRRHVIGHRILRDLGALPHFGGEMTSSYKVKRGEFQNYVQRYAGGNTSFVLENPEDFDVFCLDSLNMVAGFCKAHDVGRIIFLPYFREETRDFDQAMACLARGIFDYGSGVAEQEPQWAKSHTFAAEAPIQAKLRKAEERIGKLRSELASFEALRRLLWQREYHLKQSVSSFFSKLGIDIRQDEVFGEVFWLARDGKDIAMVEVKDMNSNVTRQDIGRVAEHRKARGLPDDFPALLVANTFATLQSITAKDKRIEPTLCRAAADEHVLVMRTLDLVRLYDSISRSRPELSAFQDTLLQETGWLIVESSGHQVVKG